MTFGEQQEGRGYFLLYRPGEVNRCPGCGRSHWWIGRVTAECGFCATSLDLPDSKSRGGGTFTRIGKGAP